MPKRGRTRKKTRTHVVENEAVASALASQEALKVPRSLVIRRGKVEAEVGELVTDIRKMMSPHTALQFQEDFKNRKATLSHYAKELTTSLGVTHILALSQNSSSLTLRMARTPSGPTLSFKLRQFSLAKHVRSVQRRPYDSASAFLHPPVVVTNNFGDATAPPHVKLMRITFQNMFPAINVANVKLADCRRVVLFNFIRRDTSSSRNDTDTTLSTNSPDDKEDEEVEVRHYVIRATPVGVDRKVRKIVQSRNVPNLSKLNDISDYIMGTTSSGAPAPSATSGNMSDSEPEDETSHVVLPQKYIGRGNATSQKSALKLVELGPRLRLKLAKVERGMAGGDVMYHAYVNKTPQEAMEQKQKITERNELKRKRKEEQDENVARKEKLKQDKKQAKLQRKLDREQKAMQALRNEHNNDENNDINDSNLHTETENDGDSSDDASQQQEEYSSPH
eukprot:CAMPEP_0184856042 /NCGR_PEP_ID=MMETSP0580-20130426/1200_1 /TAXON_ID=1118495 /ORGANISM="Dactyliosolen fragilissimus" /LENGTH=448 /DNA_ID=CAMNT_0027350811 /DNA_START=33 /DNA_END=1379 /DNA_ORIENTATION=-